MDLDAAIAVLSLVITPRTLADSQKLASGLEVLRAEDRALELSEDPVTGGVTIGCTSEQHLELVVDRLAREYKVAAAVSRPHVIYRPALTDAVDSEMKYARTTAAGGLYAHVVIRLSPRPPGAGYVFEGRGRGEVPAQWVAAVDSGIRDVLSHEGLDGHPITDVRVELCGGSYHDTDSSDAAFESAAALATRDALRRASLVLLEPIMRVEVTAPPDHLVDIVERLVSSGASVQSAGNRATTLIPMSGLVGYGMEVRSLPGGRGTCTVRLAGFAQVRPGDDDGESPIGVRLRPSSPRRDSGVALPEPDEPRAE